MEWDLNAIKKILNQYFDSRYTIILIYGSVARNAQNNNSDIDIAIYDKNGEIPIDSLATMAGELSLRFHKELDLVDIRCAEGLFLYEIITGNVSVRRDPAAYHYYLMKAIYWYEDFRPIQEACQRERIERFISMDIKSGRKDE